MKQTEKLYFFLCALFFAFCANLFAFFWFMDAWEWLFLIIPLFLILQIFPTTPEKRFLPLYLKVARRGVTVLKQFIWVLVLSIVQHIVLAFVLFPKEWAMWLWSALWCAVTCAIVFWHGMIAVYCSSVQLGIRRRVIGLLCGMIPILNLVQLHKIIRTVSVEVSFETEKLETDIARKKQQICATKYPILFVHGVFFRDTNFFNYWGRIPAALKANGAKIYYGEHGSAASVADAAEELAEKIRDIVKKTGCEKVNIIAHSKGGLDCRYAIAMCGIAPYVASLTTINTPHRGCTFADHLLSKIPNRVQNKVAESYNAAMRNFGDEEPDFMAAVQDLTTSASAKRNEMLAENDHLDGIFVQSIGSRLLHAVSGKFPLNLSYPLVKYFDGTNDGLVSETSFSFGKRFRLLTPSGKRGISHGDVIDLNRENIEGFDVREFYVELVSDLKERGF